VTPQARCTIILLVLCALFIAAGAQQRRDILEASPTCVIIVSDLAAGCDPSRFAPLQNAGADCNAPAATLAKDGLCGASLEDLQLTCTPAMQQELIAEQTCMAAMNGCVARVISFVVTAPAAVQSGVPFTFTVQTLNAGGGQVTGADELKALGNVHFSAPLSPSGTFTLPPDTLLTSGQSTFTATLTFNPGGVQTQTIAVTDVETGLAKAQSASIQVQQLPRLVLTAPATVASGVPFLLMVSALDVNNNILTGYTGTLHFDSTLGAATLPPDSVLTNGTGFFTATLRELGTSTQFIGATDTANQFITGVTGPIKVTAGASDPASSFLVTVQTPVISGVPFTFTVTALNDSGSPTTNYEGKVQFSTTGQIGTATLPAGSTLTQGSGTFSATIVKGNVTMQTVVATDAVRKSITGQSALFTVQTPGVPEFRTPAADPHQLLSPPAAGAATAAACPAIAFFQPQNVNTLDFDITGQNVQASVLYREPDGNFTAEGFAIESSTNTFMQLFTNGVGTPLGNIPQAQRFFANCRGLAPWTPAPHPTVLSDMPGTMAQFLVVSNLGGAPYSTIMVLTPYNMIGVSQDSQGTLGQSVAFYPVGVSPIAIRVADFNGDGQRDVAVLNVGASGSPGSVSILLGKGNGLLSPATAFTVGQKPVAMTSFDFNQDGHADLAVVNQLDNTVTVLIANADGSMKPGATYPLPGTASDTNAIVAADFDGDGKADLLAYSSTGFSLLHGNGDGSFQVLPQKTGYSVKFGTQFLAPGDFNKDGHMDVASYNSDNTVTILLNGGDGSFPTTNRYVAGSALSAGASSAGMYATDLNDDGNLDLVFGAGHPDAIYANPAYITVLLGNGNGTLQAAPAIRVGVNTSVMAKADFNGDTRTDLVVGGSSSTGTPELGILLGASGGGFQTPTTLALPSSGVKVPWVTTGDLNADGHADIIALDDNGRLFTLLGNGNGTFQTPSSFPAGSGASFVAAADLNGDGRSDVVIAYGTISATTAAQTNVTVATATANGFSAGATVPTGPNTLQVALVDVNGDNNLDLIAVNHGVGKTGLAGAVPSAGNVSVSFGNGDGTFQPPVAYTVGLNPISIAVADVTGDGKPDLIVGTVTATAAFIAVLPNLGNGAFGSPSMLSTYSWPAGITVADFDGDGKQDLAIVHLSTDAPVSILRGHGDGTFDGDRLLFAGSAPQSAIALDFTGDGKLDLAISNFAISPGASGTVNLFANLSGIQPSATHFSIVGPTSATAGTTSGFVVTALDASNNIVTSYNGTVQFTSSDSAASLPGPLTFTAASQGVFAITTTLKSPGSQTVTATDTLNPSITGTSGPVAVAGAGGPAWTVGITHISNFSLAQPLAFFTITVANTQSLSPTSGGPTVSVVSPVPVTLTGPNWNCGATSCTRSDSLAGGASYPAITAAVNLTSFAITPLSTTVSVSGGGLASANATDSATFVPALTDVPTADLSFLPFIDLLRQTGITSGCAPTGYCPDNTITQGEMAVFVVRSVMGGDNFTFTANPYFNDVPVTNQFFKWIQKEQDLGITLTCGIPTLFCPTSPVTRSQMAVLIIRARYGLANPPNVPTTALFTDVPASSTFFPFVQKMAQVGITVGCAANMYCGDNQVTRGQMAVFIMKGMFNLLLPGAPTVLSAAPASVPLGQTATVTIQALGTNFVSGSTQVSAGPGITATNVNVINGTTLTAQFTASATTPLGPRSIFVLTGTGTQEATLPNVFTVTAVHP
jgi:hypothetical protein